MKSLLTILMLGVALVFGAATSARAQETRERQTTGNAKQDAKARTPTTDRLEPDDERMPPTDLSPEMQAGRRGSETEDESAILPYYNNFLTSYRLGPEDVISVEVFGQERYSKSGIVIPPDGRISYIHIKGGLHVAGKTTQQVEEDIRRVYDEYIIDPVINVRLEKASSARYSVLGDVAQPGVRIITRRNSVAEAIAEAGGVLATGDRSKVVLLRRQANGTLLPIPVNLKAIQRGKAPDNVFVGAGDQIIVPGNRLKTLRSITELFSIISFARIFTGGF